MFQNLGLVGCKNWTIIWDVDHTSDWKMTKFAYIAVFALLVLQIYYHIFYLFIHFNLQLVK